MKIHLIGIGKLKEKYLVDAVNEYIKRLKGYVKIEIDQLAEEPGNNYASPAEENIIKKKEGERILSKIDNREYVVALDIFGEQLSSEEFSMFIESNMTNGVSTIAFVVGGSLGLSEEVLERADYKLSFSKMTFTHQFIRVLLLEQIYRGFKIMRKEPYHK